MRYLSSVFLLSLMISGCGGGSSGENGPNPFGDTTNTTATIVLGLEILNSDCRSVDSPSFDAGEVICAQATLTRDGSPAEDELVQFSITSALGELSADSALTNDDGIAQILISNSGLNVGANTLTATFESNTDTANYEYTSVTASASLLPVLDVLMLQNNVPVTRFNAGDEISIQATLANGSGQPIAEEIVQFSVTASRGTLDTSDALTDDNGVAEVRLTAADTDIGAGTITVTHTITGTSTTVANAINYEVRSSDALNVNEIRFGHFDADGEFIEGALGVTGIGVDEEVSIAAGATLGLSAALIDDTGSRVITPTVISFASNCVNSGLATIDTQVSTINGEAFATFEDSSCAGTNGNSDQIVATVVINNSSRVLSRTINIQPEDVGSISFVSATPENIVLQGTGGQGSESVSTLVFQVNGALGNPLAQQEVNFSLNTSVGGLTVAPTTGFTNSQGQVSTRVSAGTVPTAVRVTATTETQNGATILSQSDLLSVNTGLPDQNSFSIATSNFNPEAGDFDGVSETITVRLADSFNNPVPDGTTVNFTTEGGTIEPTCNTVSGTCTVAWTSSEPRVDDHRITILATAIGHETLLDGNGNNAYDDSDGSFIDDSSDNGFLNENHETPGFVDLAEAWRDDNENGRRNTFEPFLDFNNDGQFNNGDRLFNGPQCLSETGCGTGNANSINVRKALVMVMSGSNALWRIYDGALNNSNNIVFSNDPNISSPNALTVGTGEIVNLQIVYYDDANQKLPSGTQLGTVDGQGNLINVIETVSNSTSPDSEFVPGTVSSLATIDNSTGTFTTTSFSFVIQTPQGVQTFVSFSVSN